jgi:hypothetical protein
MTGKKKTTTKMQSANARGETQQSNKQQQFRHYGPTKAAKKESIPMLRYGKSNNFHHFKEALSQVASEKYDHLGALIERGSYYMPPYQAPERN